jgi:hypothetical protein
VRITTEGFLSRILICLTIGHVFLRVFVDKGEINKGLGDVVDTQEMVGNLIASILQRYSTINNILIKRVKRGAVRGAAQDITGLDINRAWIGRDFNAFQTQHFEPILEHIGNLLA